MHRTFQGRWKELPEMGRSVPPTVEWRRVWELYWKSNTYGSLQQGHGEKILMHAEEATRGRSNIIGSITANHMRNDVFLVQLGEEIKKPIV